MTQRRANKIDAARRQTDLSIRLFFDGEDAFGIHTLASAAYRLLRDIAEKQGNSDWHNIFKELIPPGGEKAFWKVMNAKANFLKHADKDPDAILDFDEEANDGTIVVCCCYYKSLGYEPTGEMQAFFGWYIVRNPDIISADSPHNSLLFSQEGDRIRNLPRDEALAWGKELIALSRNP